MMWQTGEPKEQGWYLCAWRIGTWDDFFVYQVGCWEDKKWRTRLGETPGETHANTGQRDRLKPSKSSESKEPTIMI